jgi:hypothetical protein
VDSGEEDDKYVELSRKMAAMLSGRDDSKGSCRFIMCRGGHAVHVESPLEVLRAVGTFLDEGQH